MPFDGNGNYDLPSPEYPAIPGEVIYAEDWNGVNEDIAGALSLAITRDGQSPVINNIPWGGFRLTNLGPAVVDTDAAQFGQIRVGMTFQNAVFGGNSFTVSASTVSIAGSTVSLISSGSLMLTGSTVDLSGSGQVTLPANTSIGVISAAEILTLDSITGNIQAQLDTKGAIAGQVWTGAHNFTGATITVPTQPAGTTNSTAASTQFVVQTSFNTGLPLQDASTRFKFPQSDGVNASWQYVPLDPYSFAIGVS